MSGANYREFIASVVQRLGYGGQRFAESVLGWNRGTIRKGLSELNSGEQIDDCRQGNSGRKSTLENIPELVDSIREIVEPTSQTDPTFRSTRIYTPLSARHVRARLKKDYGYREKELPSRRTISSLINKLGYVIRKVQKTKPLKKIAETDSIFGQLKKINEQSDIEKGVLRLSIDAKATVNVGPFSRGGKSRQSVKAVDHDFSADEKLTPYGIFIPDTNESWLWFAQSGSTTADFIADRIEEIWPELKSRYSPHTLILNIDNGPDSSGVRTQWLNRLVQFSDKIGVEIQLAYYPPYHSKYNPIERVWGILENHWNGELLDSTEKVLGLARSMIYNGISPKVRKVVKIYEKGVSLTKSAMKEVEKRLDRLKGLEKWFIKIVPEAT